MLNVVNGGWEVLSALEIASGYDYRSNYHEMVDGKISDPIS